MLFPVKLKDMYTFALHFFYCLIPKIRIKQREASKSSERADHTGCTVSAWLLICVKRKEHPWQTLQEKGGGNQTPQHQGLLAQERGAPSWAVEGENSAVKTAASWTHRTCIQHVLQITCCVSQQKPLSIMPIRAYKFHKSPLQLGTFVYIDIFLYSYGGYFCKSTEILAFVLLWWPF